MIKLKHNALVRPGETKSLGTDQKPVLPPQERFLLVLKHKEREWLLEVAWALTVSRKLNQLQILWGKDEFLPNPHTSYSLLFLPPFRSSFLLPNPLPLSFLPPTLLMENFKSLLAEERALSMAETQKLSILQPHKQTVWGGLVPRLGGAGRQGASCWGLSQVESTAVPAQSRESKLVETPQRETGLRQ